MLIEEKVFKRKEAYDRKDYELSDALRNELDEVNVFCFDHPNGFHEVHYYPANSTMTRSKLIEKMKRERKAEKDFDAWVYSMTQSGQTT